MAPPNLVNKSIATAVAALAASSAAADTTLTETIPLSQLLSSAGSDYAGSFSISSLLSSQGLSGAPILSATVTAAAYSAATADATVTVQASNYVAGYAYSYSYPVYAPYYVFGGYYSYNCSAWGGCEYAPYYVVGGYYVAYYNSGYVAYGTKTTVATTTNTDKTADSIGLRAGAALGTGVVSNQPPTTVTGTQQYAGTASNGTQGYDTLYTRADTVTQGFYGALSAQTVLGAADLYTLSSSGTLGFDVSDTLGNSRLDSVTLQFTAGTPVPLPPAAPLLCTGLAALAASARRRRGTHLPA